MTQTLQREDNLERDLAPGTESDDGAKPPRNTQAVLFLDHTEKFFLSKPRHILRADLRKGNHHRLLILLGRPDLAWIYFTLASYIHPSFFVFFLSSFPLHSFTQPLTHRVIRSFIHPYGSLTGRSRPQHAPAPASVHRQRAHPLPQSPEVPSLANHVSHCETRGAHFHACAVGVLRLSPGRRAPGRVREWKSHLRHGGRW